MFIIVSGCDRVGKTSFCNELQKQLNCEYVHFSVPKDKDQAFNDYLSFIKNADNDTTYLIDRFYECENIYAPIYRGYKQNNCRMLDALLRMTAKTLFIYIQADLEIIKQRINNIGDDYVKENDIELIVNAYQSYMNEIQLPYIILNNNTINDLQENITLSLKYINMNFSDDLFGNLQAKKAIIFNHLQIYDNINIDSRLIVEDINKKEYLSFWEEGKEYKWNINTRTDNISYTDYIFTNNDDNINMLNISERLYVNEL